MSALFSPIAIGQLKLSNRIVVAPMCQYSANNGEATDWHLIHLGSMALSGAALLTIEATAVEPEGRITPSDLGLWSDATETALSKVITSVRNHSAIPIAIQLAHAGRKASCHVPWKDGQQIPAGQGGWQTLSSSDLPYSHGQAAPAPLDRAGLERVRSAFATAAQRAHRIGIDAIEIHMAHGYLLHQFLSPLANVRTDEYGGSLENRMRFPLEVFDAVRAAFPADKPVGVRISATDWVADGWEIEQSVALAQQLRQRGCSYIHVSSGGMSPLQAVSPVPCFQVGFAERIRKETGMLTIAVGMITEPEQAEAIVVAGQADLVALARGMLFNPHWPWHAAAKLGATVEAPCQYWRAAPENHKMLFGKNAVG
ncbi:MAG TPA: NADH:flavin oxidoreductase/NADH oxidase [Gallionella sp.]|nr:NADH:flavin oxidoreductase/NADH oxidase [Gallionella sp.]